MKDKIPFGFQEMNVNILLILIPIVCRGLSSVECQYNLIKGNEKEEEAWFELFTVLKAFPILILACSVNNAQLLLKNGWDDKGSYLPSTK